jgi:hypothetical protein
MAPSNVVGVSTTPVYGGHAFPIVAMFAQGLLILFFGLFTEYDSTAVAPYINTTATTATTTTTTAANSISIPALTSANHAFGNTYPMYQDVHVITFIGFGFLMVQLRQHALGAVGLTLMTGAFCIQWALLNMGFWNCVITNTFETIPLNLDS